MTLNTVVYIQDPVDPHEVFRVCQRMLAAADDRKVAVADQSWSDEESRWSIPGARTISTTLSQGLPALTEVEYHPDHALVSPEEAAQHNGDCNVPGTEFFEEDEPVCDGSWHSPAHWVKVSFDTAYGYRDSRGWGCGELHAHLVDALGTVLANKGARWSWRNEFTGQVHEGYDGLAALGTGGRNARAWMQTVALPAILIHLDEPSE